ncbi:hypothetical protein [Plantactinospora sp. GCM10030261]|uniref:hypothetical protein n=1 Tax=Plantactinospora sp. GCM10030261 TaxID=3273420 RepID=UPI00360D8C04
MPSSPNVLWGRVGGGFPAPARLDRLLRHAPTAAVLFTSILVAVQLPWVVLPVDGAGADPRRGVWALASAVLLLVPHCAQVRAATAGVRLRGGPWALAFMVAVVLAVLPVVGAHWLPVLYAPAVSALLVLSRPWAVPVAVALLVGVVPLGLLMGVDGFTAIWYVFAAVFRGIAVYALISLSGSATRLQSARTALASEAVLVERQRLDWEIRRRLDVALQQIAHRGGRAANERDPAWRAGELRAVTAVARRTLTETRRLVGRHHVTSWRTELDTAVSLLAAAGISVAVSTPASLPDADDAEFRAALRESVARLLDDQPAGACRIEVTVRDDRPRVEVRGLAGGEQPWSG